MLCNVYTAVLTTRRPRSSSKAQWTHFCPVFILRLKPERISELGPKGRHRRTGGGGWWGLSFFLQRSRFWVSLCFSGVIQYWKYPFVRRTYPLSPPLTPSKLDSPIASLVEKRTRNLPWAWHANNLANSAIPHPNFVHLHPGSDTQWRSQPRGFLWVHCHAPFL